MPTEVRPGASAGCHRRRIPDRVVFEHVLIALVHGSGCERSATTGCSDRAIRQPLMAWTAMGIGLEMLRRALATYDRMLGLDLDHPPVDGSITHLRAAASGRSPVDRKKQGTKRSVV